MSSSEDEDDFVTFGTPLEPIDEDSAQRKKPFSIEDQVVKDKQGRRRFHGAFTGGFSAGFFNTVGSLEGWTPATFKSSRAGKAERKGQRPEDFMDEEDMEEHGIAPRVLRATTDYSEQIGKTRDRMQPSEGPIPGTPVLQQLLQPANDTVGAKLLRRMGWKPGQGVGPRLSRAEKRRVGSERQAAGGRVYGCALPDFTLPARSDGDESDGSDDDDLNNITFAPDDYEPFLCRPKDNCFGIGYVGLDKRPVLSSHINLFEPSSLNMTDKNKKVNISGQAFGVGAFEEEDSDIYARDDMSQYDFSLESGSSSAKSKSSQRKRPPRWSQPELRPTCLEGFEHPPLESMVRKKFFPPPQLPRDYKPVHVTRTSRFEPAPPQVDSGSQARRKGLERHSLTADDRSHIIGEKTTCVTSTEGPSTSLTAVHTVTTVQPTKPVDLFGSRFRPFVAEPEKQQRYEQFLALSKQEQAAGLLRLQPLSMLEWEREHERMEFEQASRLYQPMTGIMNDRFVSATQPDDATNPMTMVERSRPDVDKDMLDAAKMKMFGRLTREKTEWRPTSLLCKRFNIPEPFTGGSSAPSFSTQKRSSKFSVFDYLDAAQKNKPLHLQKEEAAEPESVPLVPVTRIESTPVPSVKEVHGEATDLHPRGKDVHQAASKDVNLEFPDLPTKIDLFKAIFLSSSEDSESEEETETTGSVQPPVIPDVARTTEVPVVLPEIIKNVERNTSPPRGVFANLDFDALNRRKPSDSSAVLGVESSVSVQKGVMTSEDATTLPPGAYGPPLPSAPILYVPQDRKRKRSSSSSSGSSGSWEESSMSSQKEKHSRKPKHKKKKKHKTSKSKSVKHKKHKKYSHKKKHKHK